MTIKSLLFSKSNEPLRCHRKRIDGLLNGNHFFSNLALKIASWMGTTSQIMKQNSNNLRLKGDAELVTCVRSWISCKRFIPYFNSLIEPGNTPLPKSHWNQYFLLISLSCLSLSWKLNHRINEYPDYIPQGRAFKVYRLR